jgi:hypothetical protein
MGFQKNDAICLAGFCVATGLCWIHNSCLKRICHNIFNLASFLKHEHWIYVLHVFACLPFQRSKRLIYFREIIVKLNLFRHVIFATQSVQLSDVGSAFLIHNMFGNISGPSSDGSQN